MTETSRAKATVTFQGIEVTATKDRHWKVEAAGRSATAVFLDQALEIVAERSGILAMKDYVHGCG